MKSRIALVPSVSAVGALALIGILGSTTLLAQSEGWITGTVADVTGRAIPGAGVIVRNDAGGAPHQTVAGADGKFSVADLAAGSYSIEASAPSFAPATVLP
jgi:hypothetical protein